MTIRRSNRLAKLPRVNYTGMDTIEPECEYDYITNIWADETIYEDPDYIPSSKNIAYSNTYSTPNTKSTTIYTYNEQLFLNNAQILINTINNSPNLHLKAEYIYELYQLINIQLLRFMKLSPSKWMQLARVVYNKTSEFQLSITKIATHPLYKCIVSEFNSATKNLAPYFANTSRPRRNIPLVNYTGMDTIEPESEYDGITDIWADLTIYEDPDYILEDNL